MTARRRRAAALAAALSTTAALASCGADGTVASRPAHRPISVIYVAGETTGPWAARTEGLADGVKLAIAQRKGLIGERAASIVVVPVLQRDGAVENAAIGAGRIVRDSRTLAILGAYSAPDLALAAPQFNAAEVALLQFGSGMEGLTEAEAPGEPGRYEPSGQRFALRVTPSDQLVGERVAKVSGLRGAQVVAVTNAYQRKLAADEVARTKLAKTLNTYDKDRGVDPPTPTDPSLLDASPEIPDAERLAARIAEQVQGQVVGADDADASGPTIVVTDSSETNPSGAAHAVLANVRGTALVVDAADRELDPAVIARGRGSAATYLIRRSIAPTSDALATKVRAEERKAFGRDRGAAVVAGYRAAERILELAANQPERTIDRVAFARALVGAAPNDPNLKADADGSALLGSVDLFRLSGTRWTEQGS